MRHRCIRHLLFQPSFQLESIGTTVALPNPLVRFTVFVLLSVVARPVFSQGLAGDPFATYHNAIEQQLATMSDQRVPRPPEQLADTAPTEPKSSATMGEFASRFWNGRADDLRNALARLARHRPSIEPILEQEGVPRSLIAVALIESGAQPFALSPKDARGLWQFIPATAKQYGLVVTTSKDERVNVELSTRAAARYLRDLYAKFRNWSLALAAYNAGPDTVDRALRRGRGNTFAEISAARLIPEETRNYVPAVISAMDLLGVQQIAVSPSPIQVRTANVLYAPAIVSN